MTEISKGGYAEPLKEYVDSGKPFLGICVGLQALFDGSEENTAVPGLGVIPGQLQRFSDSDKAVPHIGWNSARPVDVDTSQQYCGLSLNSKYYYVHSYAVPYRPGVLEKQGWHVATARYGDEDFVGAIWRDNILATQFHPEKSGPAGLRLIDAFLRGNISIPSPNPTSQSLDTGLTRRIIACLDVRTNDDGDLVVTKGDQYDVREKPTSSTTNGNVRNLGKPVEVAQRYYHQGADEITFLNITSFRSLPLTDLPMLEILRLASESIFIPLTVGGGIKDTLDPVTNRLVPAVEIANLYFRSGADKVSIGGDAVLAAEQYWASADPDTRTSPLPQQARPQSKPSPQPTGTKPSSSASTPNAFTSPPPPPPRTTPSPHPTPALPAKRTSGTNARSTAAAPPATST